MSSHSSSRKCGARVNGAVGGGSGDMPATRKLSGKADCAQGRSGPFPSSLEVLEHGDADDASTRSSSRISLGSRSRSNLSSVPPRSDSALSQRVPTPTKHVSLTAVRRKQEVDTPIEPELDWRQFSRSNSKLSLGSRSYSNTFRLTETDETQEDSEEKHKAEAHSEPSSSGDKVASQMEALSMDSAGQSKVKDTKEISDDNDDESDDSDDSDSEDEPRKAPNELLMEFLDCVMKKDFKNAEKLCRMILIYEPTNQEALTFHPIIMEKLQLEQEAAEARDNDDDDDDDEDDDDDSEEDSSLESDSSDDDDDDDDDDAEEQEEGNGPGDVIFPEEPEPGRPDSGIGM